MGVGGTKGDHGKISPSPAESRRDPKSCHLTYPFPTPGFSTHRHTHTHPIPCSMVQAHLCRTRCVKNKGLLQTLMPSPWELGERGLRGNYLG